MEPLSIKAVFKSVGTLRQALVRVKEKTPQELRKGVVYQIPCRDCESVYVGETERTLKKRITEHKYAVKRYDDKNGVAVHAWQMDHSLDWDSARVLVLAPYIGDRKVIEAIHIRQHASTMNLDCGLHISPIWNPLLASFSLHQ